MDDDLDPKDKDLEDVDGEGEDMNDLDDDLILGKKKPKKKSGDEDVPESLDALAEEESDVLPEDSYDDEDLW